MLYWKGGTAHLSEINKKIEGHPKTKTNPTWKDTIRRVVRQYKIFESVPPERSGIYRLLEEAQLKTEPQSFIEKPDVDHGIAQGMLLTLGRIYGYEIFAPSHDRTIRSFQNKPLEDFATVKDCTDVFKGPNLSKIREIDAIWFDEDDYGLFPVYAFEVEETTGVKSGLDRLLKIPRRFSVRFYIIAPSEKEKSLFDRYVNQYANQKLMKENQDLKGHQLSPELKEIIDMYKEATKLECTMNILKKLFKDKQLINK